MEFLFGTLLFLAGWFVCWIQMSQSESRQLQESKYLAESRLKALKNRQVQISELKSQLRQTTSRLIDSDYRLWDFQQTLKESQSPVPPQFETHRWVSPYPEMPSSYLMGSELKQMEQSLDNILKKHQ